MQGVLRLMRSLLHVCVSSCVIAWCALGAPVSHAQSSANGTAQHNETGSQDEATPVRFRGRTLFEVNAPLGDLGVAERAAGIETRLLQLAAGPAEVLGKLRISERDGAVGLMAGDVLIRIISDDDTRGTGRTRRQLAADQLRLVHDVLTVEFNDRGTAALVRSFVLAAVATIVVVLAAIALVRGYGWMRVRLMMRAAKWQRSTEGAAAKLISWSTLSGAARTIAVAGVLLFALLILYLYLEFVLSLFPWTRGLAASLVSMASGAVTHVLSGLVDYVPKLFNIVVIVVVARIALRLVRVLFDHIATGGITLRGFYPEWSTPTYSLLRFFVIAVSAVMIFPYLPGSGSEGFKGVSVFIGLLLSLGAATAIGNVISGVVITYMRPFTLGDRVRIADAVGDVIGKDLFVVRLRTIKNVDITVPNALVLANHIINYTSGAREHGLILHTRVTIGYGAPWQKVHELLIEAAGRVEGILGEPRPFVLQISLDDFYVTYELNAHTNQPNDMADLYSALHAEIQSAFAAAGVEIMSPHYHAVRDGGRMAVPDDHLPKNYVAPSLRIWPVTPGGQTSGS